MTYVRLAARLMLIVVLAASMALPGALLARTSQSAQAYSGISIVFEHPEFGAGGKEVQCTVSMYGGPAADLGGQYNWSADVTASANETGAAIVPSVGAARESGVWIVNVTLPDEGDQTVTVKIVGTSKATSGASVTASSEFEIRVVVPVEIKATVYNRGDVDANNVIAKIFADGALLSTQTINVTAGASVTISYNWTFMDVKRGKHMITVTIDDPSNVVEFSNGNNVFTQEIFIGTPGNPAGVALTIGVIIAAVLVVLMWLQKPMRRPLKKP